MLCRTGAVLGWDRVVCVKYVGTSSFDTFLATRRFFLSIVTSVALAVPNLNVEWAIGPDSELKFGSEIKKPLETQGACEDGGSSQN